MDILEQIATFFQNKYVLAITNTTLTFLTTMIGATLLYLVASNNGVTIKAGISRLIRNKSDHYYDRMEFFIFVFIGAFVGQIVFQPQTYYSALAAGFGWVGGLSTLINNRPTAAPPAVLEPPPAIDTDAQTVANPGVTTNG